MHLHQALTTLADQLPENLTVERISSAKTNAVYRLTGASQRFALRINNPNAASLGIDRNAEQAVLAQIEGQPWAPSTVYLDKHQLLTHWHNGTPLDIISDQTLEQLAQLILSVHSLPAQSASIPILNLPQRIRELYQWAQGIDDQFWLALNSRLDDYQMPSQAVLCHHDWHPGNILSGHNTLTLLDWEYAAYGDPLVDFACLCSGYDLNADQQRRFLQHCGMAEDSVNSIRALTEALSLLWYRVRFPEQDHPKYQQDWLARWR